MKALFLLAIFIPLIHSLTSSVVHAAIDFEDAVFPELIKSGRALSMGNAYIAKVDDSAAAFYNPAGLGTVRYPHFHLSNLHLEVNRGWMRMGTGGRATEAAGNFSKGFDLDGTRQLLNDHRGEISHTRFQFMPNFTSRYFSIGYLLSRTTRATIGTAPDAMFEYADRWDHGPYAAFNLSMFGGIVKFGVTGTLLNRKEILGEADPDASFNVEDDAYKKGLAALITTGFRLTLPTTFLPTFAAVIHNTADNDFSGRAGGAPDAIKKTIDLGVSLTPQIGKGVRVHLEGNYKDVNGAHSEVATTRKLLAGMEIDIRRTFFMRLGYGDGFGSGGIGIRSRSLEFDLTTYAVDATTNEFRGKEDRRFAITISSGF